MTDPVKKIDYTNVPAPKIAATKPKPLSDEPEEKVKAVYQKNRRAVTPHPKAFKNAQKQLTAKK